MSKSNQTYQIAGRQIRLADILLALSTLLLSAFLILFRPPLPFLALFLAPIALTAVIYELLGGTLAALAIVAGVAVILALDPDPARRAEMLQEAWPMLVAFLVVGPLVGWLVGRDRERERQLLSTTNQLSIEQNTVESIAAERARLYDLERGRAKALAAISEAGREIAASVDLDRTLQMVMSKAAETLPMDAGALFVFDQASQLYRVAVSHNLPPEHVDQITFAFDEGVPGWVVKHRKPLIINDAAADLRVHPYVIDQKVQSVLATPLISRERIVGVLNLFGRAGSKAFDDEALRLALVYADQAAVFIENARLVEELRQAASKLEARVDQRTRELHDSQAQVIRAEKMAAVGRLAASVAHEVNNPLQAIALHLQLVSDEGLSETGIEQVDIVQHELDRIANIVQRLLEFQRPKSSRRSLQNLAHVLDDVLALAGKQLQNANVVVEIDLQDGISPILAAGDQLKQVFLNLILNAVEAMPDGGRLLIRAQQRFEEVAIFFADTGSGIRPDEMSQIFEPFFSTKHTGSGLGLAVSHEIIVDHGGTLEAENKPGQGATFTVRLPAQKKMEAVNAIQLNAV